MKEEITYQLAEIKKVIKTSKIKAIIYTVLIYIGLFGLLGIGIYLDKEITINILIGVIVLSVLAPGFLALQSQIKDILERRNQK